MVSGLTQFEVDRAEILRFAQDDNALFDDDEFLMTMRFSF